MLRRRRVLAYITRILKNPLASRPEGLERIKFMESITELIQSNKASISFSVDMGCYLSALERADEERYRKLVISFAVAAKAELADVLNCEGNHG